MTRINDLTQDNELYIRAGMNGNYYVFSKDIEKVKNICDLLNKSQSSIYFRNAYMCYCIRIRNRRMITKLKEIKNNMNANSKIIYFLL